MTRPSHPSSRIGAAPDVAEHPVDPHDEVLADIAETREHLAETVAALAAKADVKSRAKHRATELKADLMARARRKGARSAALARDFTDRLRASTSRTAPATRPTAIGSGAHVAEGGATTLGTGAITAGAVAVGAGAAVAAVVLRRRQLRRRSPWQRALRTARQGGAQVRRKAGTVTTGDLATRARSATASATAKGRRAAHSAALRTRGRQAAVVRGRRVVVTAGLLTALGLLGRARRQARRGGVS